MALLESVTMMWQRQSMTLGCVLPAWIGAVASINVLGTTEVHAQDRYRVVRTENFRREPAPNGRLLASVEGEVDLIGTEIRDAWVQVTMEGWVWRESLRFLSNGGARSVAVNRSAGENLREGPNGRVIARLRNGFQAEELERTATWVRVRRTGWMYGRSLERIADQAGNVIEPSETNLSSQTSDSVETSDIGLDFALLARDAVTLIQPGGDTVGTLRDESPVRILARSGEWVRVRSEAWVREDDLRPASQGVLVGVTAAEVRARPDEFAGLIVQWRVQYIATKTADDLRRELPAGRQYILARGPLPEAAYVYVLLEDEHVTQLERIPPLSELVILGRIRAGRSRFLGNPVIDLIEMRVREP